MPGLEVVSPSLAHHPGLREQPAGDDPAPVLFVEHKILYPLDLLEPGNLPPPLVLEEIPDAYPVVRLSNFNAGSPDVGLIVYGDGVCLTNGVPFVNLIDPSVVVHSGVRLGEGTSFSPFAASASKT